MRSYALAITTHHPVAMFLIGALLPVPVLWYLTSRSWTGIFILPLLGILISITRDPDNQMIGAGMLVSGLIGWFAGTSFRNRHRLRRFARILRRAPRSALPQARIVRSPGRNSRAHEIG